MKPGVIFVPYIIQHLPVTTIQCGTFSPNKTLRSRYSSIFLKSKNLIRKDKIEKILNEKPLD